MSGVVGAATKAFSSVAEGVADFGSEVVSGATSLFTGAGSGAAAEAAGTTLGDVFSSTVSSAAVGAGAGALTSLVTDGDVGKGALWGGGIGGALGLGTSGIDYMNSGVGAGNAGIDGNAALDSAIAENPSGGDIGPVAPGGMNTGGRAGPVPASASAGTEAASTASPAAPITTSTAGKGGAAQGMGGFLSSEVGGNVIAGLGQGYAGYAQAEAAKEAAQMRTDGAIKRDRLSDERIADNYRTGGGGRSSRRGLLSTNQSANTAPSSGPAAPAGARYRYNRRSGQIEFV